MKVPLDKLVENRIGWVRVARTFSNVVSPPVMFAVLGLAIALKERPLGNALSWALVYGFFVSLAPILLVAYLLKTGRIEELHMTNIRERQIPYIAAIFFSTIALVLITQFEGPRLLKCLTIFNVVELIFLSIINNITLISLHATGIMATMLLVGAIFGWKAGLTILPLVVLVCAVRLYLKRHTPIQIFLGLMMGALSAWSLYLVGCL